MSAQDLFRECAAFVVFVAIQVAAYRKLHRSNEAKFGELLESVLGTKRALDAKLDETQALNKLQIHHSNDFNTKLNKLQEQTNLLARGLDRLGRQLQTIGKVTGIAIEKKHEEQEPA